MLWYVCYVFLLLGYNTPQGVRDAVNTGRWAKRTPEARVMRPDLEKIQLEPGVRGQEGPHLPPEEDVREKDLSRLSQH